MFKINQNSSLSSMVTAIIDPYNSNNIIINTKGSNVLYGFGHNSQDPTNLYIEPEDVDGYGQWGEPEKEITFKLFDPFLVKNSDNLWKALTLNIKNVNGDIIFSQVVDQHLRIPFEYEIEYKNIELDKWHSFQVKITHIGEDLSGQTFYTDYVKTGEKEINLFTELIDENTLLHYNNYNNIGWERHYAFDKTTLLLTYGMKNKDLYIDFNTVDLYEYDEVYEQWINLGPMSDTGEQLSKLNVLTDNFSVFYKDDLLIDTSYNTIYRWNAELVNPRVEFGWSLITTLDISSLPISGIYNGTYYIDSEKNMLMRYENNEWNNIVNIIPSFSDELPAPSNFLYHNDLFIDIPNDRFYKYSVYNSLNWQIEGFPTDNIFSKIIIGTNINATVTETGEEFYDLGGELLTINDFTTFQLNNPIYIYKGNTFIGQFNVTYYNDNNLPEIIFENG